MIRLMGEFFEIVITVLVSLWILSWLLSIFFIPFVVLSTVYRVVFG